MTPRQAEFREALLDPALPVPPGLTDPAGRPAGRRFAVYRNNVAVGLTEALAAGFPVLVRLLGEAFFRAMAGLFVRLHPPATPVLLHYGEALPGFLAAFPPVAHLPYLPDVARLELALRAACHAADAAPLEPARLAALPPDRLAAARLRLAPAVRLLRSAWPIHGIWRMNGPGGGPPPDWRAEDVLVTRPGFDPVPQLLPPGGAAFVAALAAGETLAAAADRGAAAAAAFDLSAVLALLLGGDAIIAIVEPAFE